MTAVVINTSDSLLRRSLLAKYFMIKRTVIFPSLRQIRKERRSALMGKSGELLGPKGENFLHLGAVHVMITSIQKLQACLSESLIVTKRTKKKRNFVAK